MVRKEGSEYFVFNKEGTKKLSKGYSSKAEAVKRLGQIEYFKSTDSQIMRDFEDGKLKSLSGELVTSRKQAHDMLRF